MSKRKERNESECSFNKSLCREVFSYFLLHYYSHSLTDFYIYFPKTLNKSVGSDKLKLMFVIR